MKLKDFRKKMEKVLFTTSEAHIVAFRNSPQLVNVQLHQWKTQGDIISLKRGLYMFSDVKPAVSEIARHLYSPCYFSLEYVLNLYGIIPEAVFSYTLVTTKKTRQFKTPVGHFIYHTIKKETFTGFDAHTLLAEPEKAFVDYFYFNSSRLKTDDFFWKESRLNGTELNFKKVFHYAKLFKSKKLITLLADFQNYEKTH